MLKHVTSSESWQKKTLGAKGFTLIELLVVIVILGILAAVVVFAVSGITDKGNEAACKTEARAVKTAVESFNAQEDGYPTAETDLVPEFLESAPENVTITYNGATTQPGYAWNGTGGAGCSTSVAGAI